MKRTLILLVVAGAVAALAGGLALGPSLRAQGDQGAWLVTPEEASLADAPPETPPPTKLRVRGRAPAPEQSLGPILEMVTPGDGQPTKRPVSVFIKFTPNQAPIDLATLKVTLLKIIKIDVTDRLRPYASPEGIRISDAKFPTGHFRLRLRLADVKGNESSGEGELVVM